MFLFGDNKTGRSVKFSVTNGRNGFTGETVVDSFACQCCRTAISCDDKKNISILFRDILSDSIRDMSLITSTDNGKTFSKAKSFTNDGWVINGCPHNGPSVINVNGNSFATWFTGGQNSGVYYAALNNKREVMERKNISVNARNIQLCAMPGNVKLVVYNEMMKIRDSFYTRVMINKIEGDKMFTTMISSETSKASYPVLHCLNNNRVVVAWEENNNIFYRVISSDQITKPATPSNEKIIFPAMKRSVVKLSSHTDPVCGMQVKDTVPDTLLCRRNILGFCGDNCKQKFIATLKNK